MNTPTLRLYVKEGRLFLVNAIRDICYAHCEEDNFPNLKCKKENISLSYGENVYDNFFFYPFQNTSNFNQCKGYVSGVRAFINSYRTKMSRLQTTIQLDNGKYMPASTTARKMQTACSVLITIWEKNATLLTEIQAFSACCHMKVVKTLYRKMKYVLMMLCLYASSKISSSLQSYLGTFYRWFSKLGCCLPLKSHLNPQL